MPTSNQPESSDGAPPKDPGRLVQRWLDLPLRRKGFIVALLPMLALIPASVGGIVLSQQQSHRRAETRAETAVRTAAADVLTVMIDAETGVRGYAATHDDTLLGPFNKAKAEIASRLAALETAAARTGDSYVSEAVADGATDLMRDLDAVRIEVAASSEGVISESVRRSLRIGKVAMDTLRQQVVSFEAAVDLRISAGRADIDQIQRTMVVWLISALIAGGLAVLAGTILLTRGVVRRLKAVTKAAHDMVAGRELAHIPGAKDEIGVMVADLAFASDLLARSNVELGVSRDQALEATRAKDEFLSRVSHELRTPLTAIIGFGQLLQMEDLTPSDLESVNHIVTAGRHLNDLINDLIDISQIESGNLPLSIEPVQLLDLIDETITLLGPMATRFGVNAPTVSHRGDTEGDGTAVLADRRRLKQVLLNLISNAIKYNVVGGTVEVRATSDVAGRVRVEVVDSGQGISQTALGRLFQPFERLDAEHSGIEGTGVGLALSKSLVEAMHGAIGADSVKGEGSTFWIELPRGDELAPTSSAGLERALTHSTVLYVEDNSASVSVVRKAFAGRREHLEVVGQGGLVRDVAAGLQPALILLDQHLPDMTGEDVLLQLKADQRTRGIPVAIVSAEMSAGRRRRLIELGAIDYLHKPIDMAQVFALVDQHAGGQSEPPQRGLDSRSRT
jgi:signal transduction histidine kinase/ActR/RegA family two-component response regulator